MRIRDPLLFALVSAALAGCGGSSSGPDEIPLTVSKAACGPNDKPETALQGQVPAAMRSSFGGFNCNLQLVGQFRGEGGNWSAATFRDRAGRTCIYHSTAAPADNAGVPIAGRVSPGVPVVDITDPANPKKTMSLTSPAMLDPWESLRVNARRQILIADNAQNGGVSGGPEVDIYDISGGCANPQLLSSTKVGTGQDGGVAPSRPVLGHEGNIAPDGQTYYIGNLRSGMYHAVDITNTTKPKMLATFDMRDPAVNPIAVAPHGVSVSNDGNRLYAVALHFPTPAEVLDRNAPPKNGFLILDTSEIQSRKPDAKMKLVSYVAFKDGSIAQHTIPVKIAGRPYVVMVDEGGSGGLADPANVNLKNACSMGMAPFPMARLFDISDEKVPKLVSKMMLEIHDPANCSKVEPDVVGLTTFTYGAHYCSVDNRDNATALACGYFNSGIRVFDIRDPARPREIAYFNPAGTTSPVYGSNHVTRSQWRAGGPDWCASRLDFDHARGLLTTMCQDNGVVVLRFAPDVWPFPESTPSTEQS